MSSALIPVVGAAAGALASGAAKTISGGLSFLAQLTGGETSESQSAAASEAELPPADALEALRSRMEDFMRRLKERMLQAGLAADQRLDLQQEPWGSIAVNDDHPQRERVEAILASDPLLASEFHQLADDYRAAIEAAGQNLSRVDVFQMSAGADGVAAGFVR